MNRGSNAPPNGLRQAKVGFNEAPIHESGKFQSWIGCWAERNRFNEAPIHESGKLRQWAGWRIRDSALQ